jgi:AcrR family transcriptional regulator
VLVRRETSGSDRTGRRPAAARAGPVRRRERDREILAATRALFDARGFRRAQIDDVARAVGVNRAVIYRHFSGKEELFALTLVGYAHELDERIDAAVADNPSDDPAAKLRLLAETFVDFCLDYPAFVDCAFALLQRPVEELVEEISEGAFLRLGREMSYGLRQVAQVLREGADQGQFAVDDPYLAANLLLLGALGSMHLARLGVAVTEAAPGVPKLVRVPAARVRKTVIEAAVATVSGTKGGAP